ncbi:MAG: phosphodiester glycosidase family protein [Chloroflexi bacterium]|nr:phosphodiester glycosidase family protein [Chloroflexota bacterium]
MLNQRSWWPICGVALLLVAMFGCTPKEQAQLQTQVAGAATLAVKVATEAPPKLTQAAQIAQTAIALATQLSKPPTSSAPTDFVLVTSAAGVEFWRKDYQGGNPDFVEVINLSQGASVKLFHGQITDLGTGQGVYKGDNPKIARQPLDAAWNLFSSSYPNAFCITNGQFFVDKVNEQVVDPTTLAFPLKIDEVIVSDGYGSKEYVNQKLILEIWGDMANISALTEDNLYSSPAPNIIAGLTEDANKGPNNLTGRTFAGIDDKDNNGKSEVILIFNSKTSKQADAANILRSFGADKVIMLDGGDSTQLICQGTPYITSDRTLPQTIGVTNR